MRIARIELYRVDLPYAGGVHLLSSERRYTAPDASIVRLVGDGTEGWGKPARPSAVAYGSH